jgi:hypothetical protein
MVIQDGARYHTAKETMSFVAEQGARLSVFQLPSYSPDYNPIEERPTDYTWRRRQPQQHPNLPSLPSFGGSDRGSGAALSPKGRSNLLGYLPA